MGRQASSGGRRILLTGVNGFSGRHVARRLADERHQVVGIYRSGHDEDIDGVELLQADLSNPGDFGEPFDAIVHTAATSPQCGVTDDDMVRDNVLATRNLTRYAKESGVRQFIYCSSFSVYGEIEVDEVTEETPIRNPEVYGLTKLVGERLVEGFVKGAVSEASGVSLRLPGIVGPRAHRNWLAETQKRVKRGETVRCSNPEFRFNNVVHVDDLTSFVSRLIESGLGGYRVMNLAACDAVPIEAIVTRLFELYDKEPSIEVVDSGKRPFGISTDLAVAHGFVPASVDDILVRITQEN